MRRHVSDEGLLNLLKMRTEELGRIPKVREFRYYSLIYNRFGSWDTALKKAGLKSTQQNIYTKEELIRIIKRRKNLWNIINEKDLINNTYSIDS